MSLIDVKRIVAAQSALTLSHVPDGMDAFILAELAREGRPVAYVVSDGQRLQNIEQTLSFAAPDIPVLSLPAWDCLPYDRVSPSADVSARRLSALSGLIALSHKSHPAIILVTVNAMLQKLAPAETIESLGFSARPGNQLRMDDIAARLERNGFDRVATVREVGEFAVRGGILDVFVPGSEEPVRLDFFGDTLESIRSFDPANQRTIGQVRSLDLNPMSEVTLTPETISRFRKNYLSLFGAATRDDALYAAVSEGRRFAGMEHWLPLFHDRLETVFDYIRGFRLVTDHTVREAAEERAKLIRDYYEARLNSATPGKGHLAQFTPYQPVPPERLFLGVDEFGASLDAFDPIRITPFAEHGGESRIVMEVQARPTPRWAKSANEASEEGNRANVLGQAVTYIADKRAAGARVIVSGWSEGSLDRLLQVLNEHGLERLVPVAALKDADKLKKGEAGTAVLSLEGGF